MALWDVFDSAIGRRAIVALGALYVAFALGLGYGEIAQGTPISNVLFLSAFTAGPGAILLYGGYRLPRTDIHPTFYSTITSWCLGAVLVMTGLLTLYHLQPAASLSNPIRGVLVITAFVLVPAFVGGCNDAQAKTHAFDLERAHDLLGKTQRIADVGGWEIDPETMEVYWSEHIFELLGVPGDEEPSVDEALEMYHEDDQPIIEDAIENAFHNGEGFDMEVRLHTSSGELRWLWLQGVPEIVEDEVVSLRGIAQDITERKQREQELKQRARQQEVVSDLGQFALEADDLDELMDEASRKCADVLDNDYCKVLDLDKESEELLLRQGVGWKDRIVGEASVSAVEANSQAAYTLANDHPIIVEDLETETRFSGPELLTSHDVRSGISTIIGPFDEPWGILGTHDTASRTFTQEDVNFVQSIANILAEAIERHRYQEELNQLVADLEESNQRLEQFAYAASHDLQEPLRMISSYLQLIEQRYADEFDEEGEEFLEFAVDGAERMQTMIEGLLHYSRVETQGEPLEPVELETIFEDVRGDLQVKIEETDATITADSLPRVEGDPSQLRQVFQNLVKNAIEYSGDEPPQVHISAQPNGTDWTIAVSDEGVGIDPDDQERIFEVFERAQGRQDSNGTGIGLALCQRIIKRHGDEITVDSQPGEGTTFSFALPASGEPNE